MNSRTKGKVGEREWAAWLRERGFEARRGVQYQGGPESPDVVCPDLQYFFEVKRVENLNLGSAYAQAARDAKPGTVPVVAHRRNRGEWMVTMLAEDWMELVKAGLQNMTAPPGAGRE